MLQNVKEENPHAVQMRRLATKLDSALALYQGDNNAQTFALNNLVNNIQHSHAYIDDSDVSNFHSLLPDLAMNFPFQLDDFQKRAIIQVEKENSIFVAAHTSAGKTVVAEYAIALAAAYGGKVFYTSPIKSLSNQKLRDFRTKFQSVGLVTGDVSIEEDAQCVIMTTEILRSMLYRGADVIRDLSFVIFDEVQYLNDPERGVVWEETIILLPPNVGIIMLSATAPNALEFASWVGKTKDRKVAVISTNTRPVPLQHYWLQNNSDNNCHDVLLLKQDGHFLANNFYDMRKNIPSPKTHKSKKAKDNSAAKDPNNKGKHNKKTSGKNKKSVWTPMVNFLRDHDRLPAVVFCFSKKKCESAVIGLGEHDLLPDDADKAFVHQFFNTAITRLRVEDRSLPQVLRVRESLKRGLAAHHAGLLPLIKEITEILFSKGYVKILFSTETFAMGVNMPARTVVFGAVRKHDGQRFRYLEAGEYTQMSGRAGRRGLDTVGHVYIFLPPDERIPDIRDLKRIMTGQPLSLKSNFRLTYNMILNVLRVDEMRVEEVMKQSFSEAGTHTRMSGISAILDQSYDDMEKLNISSSTEGEKFSEADSKEEIIQSLGSAAKGDLEEYAERISKLRVMSAKLTYHDLNPLFRTSIRPGRVVVAELRPGVLSLCTIFHVVPRSTRHGRNSNSPEYVRRESVLWVAYVASVNKSRASTHMKSILFPIESRRGIPHATDAPRSRITTSDGLNVALHMVQASKIVYITDDFEALSTKRIEQQGSATTEWYFRKREYSIKKNLALCADYLQRVVRRWKSNTDTAESNNEHSFLGEITERRNGMHQAFNETAETCRQIVTDAQLATMWARGGGLTELERLENLILSEEIKSKFCALARLVPEAARDPELLPEYQNRVQVLKKLDYVGEDGLSVQLKGRCACEVTTVNSIILTEIVMENILEPLVPAEIASLLSCLVCRKKNGSGDSDPLRRVFGENYVAAREQMNDLVVAVGEVQEECDVSLAFECADTGGSYVDSIVRWELAHPIYEWAKGTPFFMIANMTSEQEGDIVVCVKRLCEVLRDAQSVARCIGNTHLHEKLEEAVDLIRRDVIFNGSLYYDEQGKLFNNQEMSDGADTGEQGNSGQNTDDGKADNPPSDGTVSFDGFFEDMDNDEDDSVAQIAARSE